MKSKLFLFFCLACALTSQAYADNISSTPNQTTAPTSSASAPFLGSYSGVAHMLKSAQDYNCQLLTEMVTVATEPNGNMQQTIVGTLRFSAPANASVSDVSKLSDLIDSTGGYVDVTLNDGSYDANTHQLSLRGSIAGPVA